MVYNNNGVIGFGYGNAPSFQSDSNMVIVSGNGSVWNNRGGLSIGVSFGSGGANFGNALTISNGGAVYCGSSASGSSAVVVTGNGSVWSDSGTLKGVLPKRRIKATQGNQAFLFFVGAGNRRTANGSLADGYLPSQSGQRR
jgi:T5SS/PEP-CTERM-associated repeat protein